MLEGHRSQAKRVSYMPALTNRGSHMASSIEQKRYEEIKRVHAALTIDHWGESSLK
jgi:hypothetical protein